MGLSTSLISFWELEEASGQRNDAHGSNHLTDNNTVTSEAGVVGNAAVTVAANSEYLSRASNASLQMGDIDFAIAGWFKVNSDHSAGLVTKDSDSGSARDYTLDWEATRFRFYINGGGGGSLVTSALVSTGVRYFVVAWHDAAGNTVNISVNDGSTVSTGTGGEVPNVSAAEFQIGAREFSSSRIFADAAFDQIGIWKNRLLTADERTFLYNAGAGRAYAEIAERNLAWLPVHVISGSPKRPDWMQPY